LSSFLLNGIIPFSAARRLHGTIEMKSAGTSTKGPLNFLRNACPEFKPKDANGYGNGQFKFITAAVKASGSCFCRIPLPLAFW